MLSAPTDLQNATSSAHIHYSSNVAQLHTDESVLPRTHRRPRLVELLASPARVMTAPGSS